MQEGMVKFFKADKGYGFIVSDGKQYFVHYNSIIGTGFKILLQGEKVKFVPKDGDRGLIAVSVLRPV